MKEQTTLTIEHIREVLRVEAAAADAPVIETSAGLVRVTVDGLLRVQAIEFLDCAIDGKARAELQQATADAINNAMTRVVQARTEALERVQGQLDWKTLAGDGGSEI